VYGGHDTPSQVLLHLYSLRLDLGKANFEEYRQLALATAIVSAKRAFAADITPRAPLKLVINGDRRQPVNTREPGRELDKNDHIINFLNENTIEEEVVVGYSSPWQKSVRTACGSSGRSPRCEISTNPPIRLRSPRCEISTNPPIRLRSRALTSARIPRTRLRRTSATD